MKCDVMVVLMLQPRTTIWFQRRDVFSGRRTQGWQGRGTLHLQVLSRIGHPQRDWDQDAGDQRQQRVHVHHKYTHFIFTNSRPRLLDAVSAARRRYDQNDHAVRFLEKNSLFEWSFISLPFSLSSLAQNHYHWPHRIQASITYPQSSHNYSSSILS